MERTKSEAMDLILGREFPVLDKGWVRVVDYLGNDSSIVQAARTSCGKGTKQANEDRDLIRYLLRHDHTTPFEMCEIKLHVKCPMDVWRQWIRTRTASVNEVSSRYSIMDEMGTLSTDPEKWRTQSKNNKQGSGEFFSKDFGDLFTKQEKEIQKLTIQYYQDTAFPLRI
jgi:thymidylate synthase (FAD)